MKMTGLEKQFVNSPSHSLQVSHYAEGLLQRVDFKAGQRYLDVGCGNGAAALYLSQTYNLHVTGVDIDPDQIRLAQTESAGLNGARFMAGDGRLLPFEAGEFDIVFTNKVTHHVPYWPDVLAEMVRVLKPGGYFIYADIIFPGWMAAAGRFLAKNYAGFPTRAALEAFFEQRQFARIHRAASWVHYETILKKGLKTV
jgi:ubiquinone/menaquinone biosynthesis C-methylase UbiE